MTVKAVCDTHSHPSVEKDLDKIVEVLWENERMMYLPHSGRGNMWDLKGSSVDSYKSIQEKFY